MVSGEGSVYHFYEAGLQPMKSDESKLGGILGVHKWVLIFRSVGIMSAIRNWKTLHGGARQFLKRPVENTMLSQDQLRKLYKAPGEAAQKKQLAELEDKSRLFISSSPLVFISTYGADGRCDCSPRGGEVGFVKALSDSRIVIPDFRGNNRLDTLENVIETGRVGCLFLVPGISETLRVNGAASIGNDPDVISCFDCADSVKTYISVEIDEVYIHCGKALIRSSVWDASSQVKREDFPSLGEILNAQLGKTVMSESHSEVARIYEETMTEEVGGS